MDKSSQKKCVFKVHINHQCIETTLPAQPFSPWLRLAHFAGNTNNKDISHSNLRVLHDFELILQVSGKAWIGIKSFNASIDINAGDVVLLTPGLSHTWAAMRGSHIAVHFDLHANNALNTNNHITFSEQVIARHALDFMPQVHIQTQQTIKSLRQLDRQWFSWQFPLVVKVRDPDLWRQRLRTCVQLCNHRCQSTPAGQMQFMEILGWAFSTLQSDSNNLKHKSRNSSPPAILAMISDADLLCRDHPSVKILAQKAKMSITAFRQAFTKHTGCTPRQYWEELRMAHAARDLAETDLAAYEIAGNLGYEDPYHFSRVFKRIHGQSPHAYRKHIRRPSSISIKSS